MKLPPLAEKLRGIRLPDAGQATALIQRTLGSVGISLPDLPAAPVVTGRAEPAGRLAPPQGQFLACRLGGQAGGRLYKLYVPSGDSARRPLVVMLHGCTQSPDDFAAGTRMNWAAEEFGCLVAYPEQTATANSQRCWNWFNRADQQRGRGEPALIAAIVGEVMQHHSVDERRVYVAGLSAGGAAAAVMGATYPDLFAAIGVHSGLACGAAHDVASAFAAMRDGTAAPPRPAVATPAIVFHGDRDTTVNPRNADAVTGQLMPPGPLTRQTTEGQAPGGRGWRRTMFTDPTGRVLMEQWAVRGLGHAWSGGSQAGSFTDPAGPDATREMLRFFLTHAAKERAATN